MDCGSALNKHHVHQLMMAVCRRVQEKKEWLSELDAACGDGDHGVSMGRGFAAVEEALTASGDLTPGPLLKKVGMTLVSSVGGATGPLLGTVFLEAGKVIGNEPEVTTALLASAWAAGLEGMMKRGGAQPGDKTMVDALMPAVDALKQAADKNLSPNDALDCAVAAARTGAESTAQMISRQGKSRYLAERAIGHPDAGSYSIVTIFEAMAEAAHNPGE